MRGITRLRLTAEPSTGSRKFRTSGDGEDGVLPSLFHPAAGPRYRVVEFLPIVVEDFDVVPVAADSPADVDQQLWLAVQQNDLAAFRQLYESYGMRLLAFLSSRCRGKLDAADVAQTVWLKVWESRAKFDGVHFRGWLFRIAHNHLTDVYRHSARRSAETLEAVAEPAAAKADDRVEHLAALKDCLEQVGGDFVQVLQARLEGISTEEIARRMGIAQATVYTRADRGKELLRDCVQKKVS